MWMGKKGNLMVDRRAGRERKAPGKFECKFWWNWLTPSKISLEKLFTNDGDNGKRDWIFETICQFILRHWQLMKMVQGIHSVLSYPQCWIITQR